MWQDQPDTISVSLQSQNLIVQMAATAQVREQEKVGLVESMLRSGGCVRLRVFGASMLPALWPGDVLTVESRPPGKFIPGEIALVLSDGNFRAHRIIAQAGTQWVTRGDAVPQNDPPAEIGDLLGRVVSAERNGRHFVPPRLSRTYRIVGQVFCYCDFVRNLALRLHAARQNRFGQKVSSGMSPRHA
jgi:signal peptidase I